MTVGGTIGTRRPVYCSAIGKALVAFLPEPELTELLTSLTFERRTSQTITNVDRFRRELVRVRELGYAVDNEEFEEGLRCLAAPIFNHRGRVIATIGISGPTHRLNSETMPALAEAVKDAAAAISRELGYSLLIMDELGPG